jgi:hypothetical protein
MKTFVVIDHICEADIVVAVFSTKEKAKRFIKKHKDDRYSPDSRVRRYEGLDIEEHELDKEP